MNADVEDIYQKIAEMTEEMLSNSRLLEKYVDVNRNILYFPRDNRTIRKINRCTAYFEEILWK